MKERSYTNDLINETSPYLLQHAHNPVDWKPWNDETLRIAKAKDKPILISIGYSACHWCHVMEHESFEDTSVARIMNEHFTCIKIDREERPDVDQIYMSAVQLITGGGGWPLNCFAFPDGRPFHGGTYFRKEDWKRLLLTISYEYEQNRPKLEEFANKLTQGIKIQNEEFFTKDSDNPTEINFDSTISNWQKTFDLIEGGYDRAPKFPLPNNLECLLRYAVTERNQDLEKYVHLSLKKMARGGIYDQIGGGFARYSVDNLWKVPHFEKMLYDNAQLLSLYSKAYAQSKDEEYLQILAQTIEFIKREMTSPEGAFYSALDADSEGEEGLFYIWTEKELEEILGEDLSFCKDYYRISQEGLWEHGRNILLRTGNDEELRQKYQLTKEQFELKVAQINRRLFQIRSKRIRPGLDDKCLTSWNAMMSKGLIDAFRATGEDEYLKLAQKNIDFLIDNQLQEDGSLMHSYKNGRTTIEGFLEDYSFMISATVSIFEVTSNNQYLEVATSLLEYCNSHFYDEKASLYHFSNPENNTLISTTYEYYDNVIPSSNSQMALNLDWFYNFYGEPHYDDLAKKMLSKIAGQVEANPSAYSNWLQLAMNQQLPHYELIIVGEEADKEMKDAMKLYLPQLQMAYTKEESSLAVFNERYVAGKTLFYLCQRGSCQMPTTSLNIALDQIN